MKLEIIETPDYVLWVYDKKISSIFYDATAGVILGTDFLLSVPKGNKIHFIVGYQPKGYKRLELPLLPEMSLNEDDLVEAIRIALHEVRREKDERGIERVFSLTDAEVIERVKQSKTPKYFICEMEGESPKTEKINGKTYLVGKYV